MQEHAASMSAGPRQRRVVTLLSIVAFAIVACQGGGGGAGTAPATAAGSPAASPAQSPTGAATETAAATGTPAETAGATGTPAETAGATETAAGTAVSGEGMKIGYISLGDSVPFVKLVSDGIREEARKAGVDLVFCDSEIDAAKALACAQQMKVQGVKGVLNFQVFQESSPEICEAYGNVPTIAIDIVQEPCQVAFMGANNREAGRLAGDALGKYAKEQWNCDYNAYVSLESTAAGAANRDRMGGYRDGFTAHCPIKNERVIDGADRTDPALEKMNETLSALPGERIVVVAINEDGILGALGAARTLGRENDIFVSGQGTDPSIWKEVACNPQYIASVGYFPERYGTLLIPNIIKAVNGEEIPEEIFTEHIVINRDNIREVYPETPPC